MGKQVQQGQQPLHAASSYATGTPAAAQTPQYSQYGPPRYGQPASGQYTASTPPIPNGQRMPDVFYLQAANAAIPEDIRKEFQRDENGHVLFFPKPPISVQQPEHDYPPLHLSTKVRAARIRRRRRLEEEKKKEIEAAEIGEERVAKRQKQTHGATPQVNVEKALTQWRDWIVQHQKGTDEIWKMNCA